MSQCEVTKLNRGGPVVPAAVLNAILVDLDFVLDLASARLNLQQEAVGGS